MANLKLSIKDFPQLKKLVNGQKLTLKIKVKAGMKTLNGQEELIDLLAESMEMEEGRKMSPSEIMLASMEHSLRSQNVSLG